MIGGLLTGWFCERVPLACGTCRVEGRILGTADEISKLAALRDSGDLTPEEFETAKQQLLSGAGPSTAIRAAVPPTKLFASKGVSPRRKNIGRGCLVSIVAFFAIVVIIALLSSSSPSASFSVRAYGVIPLDQNTVRVFMVWHNGGKGSGNDQCAMNTDVHNQFGDLVNTEVNSVGTNGNVRSGASQRIYQDIGVNNGDAQYVHTKDVSFSGC